MSVKPKLLIAGAVLFTVTLGVVWQITSPNSDREAGPHWALSRPPDVSITGPTPPPGEEEGSGVAVDPDGSRTLWVDLPGSGYGWEVLRDVKPGDENLDVTLHEEEGKVVGRVRAPDGIAATDFHVRR